MLNHLIKLFLILTSIFALTGCSTFSQTFWSRPVIEDVPGGFNTLSLTADRRIAIFKSDKTDKQNPVGQLACAEALPDVAISTKVKSSFEAALEAAGKAEASGEMSEELEQLLKIAYQRTEKSDLVRQLGWQICQGYLNNAIQEDDYVGLVKAMVYATLVDTDETALKSLLSP